MKNTTAETNAKPTEETKPKPDTYEVRCGKLVDEFKAVLDGCKEDPSYDLSRLTERLEADLNLADYRFKVRQADHGPWLLYGPVIISGATCVLAIVLAVVNVLQLRQKDQDTQATLVLKVLAAPPEEGKRLLTFFEKAGLLKIDSAQQDELRNLIGK